MLKYCRGLFFSLFCIQRTNQLSKTIMKDRKSLKALSLSLSLSLSLLDTRGYAQAESYFCYTQNDNSSDPLLMAGSNACSQNGQHLPTSGVIKVLIIFFEYEDPDEESGTQWPIGELPVWVDDLIDSSPSSNPTGFATEYFHRASYGQLTILGDYLLSPQNGGVFKIPLSVPTTSQFFSLPSESLK